MKVIDNSEFLVLYKIQKNNTIISQELMDIIDINKEDSFHQSGSSDYSRRKSLESHKKISQLIEDNNRLTNELYGFISKHAYEENETQS